jgi:pimeloyl-ACP methyl ester carboxylesterase
MLVYAAELDTVTPAEEVELLKNAPVPVDLRVIPKAGHFSFMHALPPGVVANSEFDRDAALARIADETLQFLNG